MHFYEDAKLNVKFHPISRWKRILSNIKDAWLQMLDALINPAHKYKKLTNPIPL